MAAPKTNLAVFRGLIREFRRIYGKDKYHDAPAYTFLRDQYQKNNLTSEKYCRDKVDVMFQANTYLLYLQSTRKHQEISAIYKGAGEKTIEEAANLVGLQLPVIPNQTK